MTDNARELCMGEMKDTCELEGIKLHMSVWYSPELNGVAERTIRISPTPCVPCYSTPVSPNPCGQKRSTRGRRAE